MPARTLHDVPRDAYSYVWDHAIPPALEVAAGDAAVIAALEAHDTHFSFGENLGAADCDVPVERFRWLPTRQPVVLDLWEGGRAGKGDAYTITTSR